MRYGEHPYFETYKRRDHVRFREETEEQDKKGKRKRRITGRILEVEVTVELSVTMEVVGVGRSRRT